MSMWSGWGSKHDQNRIGYRDETGEQLHEVALKQPSKETLQAQRKRSRSRPGQRPNRERQGSYIRSVIDEGQTGPPAPDRPLSAPHQGSQRQFSHTRSVSTPTAGENPTSPSALDGFLHPEFALTATSPTVGTVIPQSNTSSVRPTHDGIAYPFKLKVDGAGGEGGEGGAGVVKNPSMVTLDSRDGFFDAQGSSRPVSSVGSRAVSSAAVDKEAENGAVVEEAKDRPPMDRFFTAAEGL